MRQGNLRYRVPRCPGIRSRFPDGGGNPNQCSEGPWHRLCLQHSGGRLLHPRRRPQVQGRRCRRDRSCRKEPRRVLIPDLSKEPPTEGGSLPIRKASLSPMGRRALPFECSAGLLKRRKAKKKDMHAAGTFAQPEEWQKNLDYLGDGTQPSGRRH